MDKLIKEQSVKLEFYYEQSALDFFLFRGYTYDTLTKEMHQGEKKNIYSFINVKKLLTKPKSSSSCLGGIEKNNF